MKRTTSKELNEFGNNYLINGGDINQAINKLADFEDLEEELGVVDLLKSVRVIKTIAFKKVDINLIIKVCGENVGLKAKEEYNKNTFGDSLDNAEFCEIRDTLWNMGVRW